jgi:phytoene/squalene synthetase
MSTKVTVTLPDDTFRRAEYVARLMGRDIADVLAETIGVSFQPLGPQQNIDHPVADLSDTEVLVAADAQMDPATDQYFGDLLAKQQAGHLTQEERPALLAMMQVYQDGLLRKAQALNEAVRRGLRPPLEP